MSAPVVVQVVDHGVLLPLPLLLVHDQVVQALGEGAVTVKPWFTCDKTWRQFTASSFIHVRIRKGAPRIFSRGARVEIFINSGQKVRKINLT